MGCTRYYSILLLFLALAGETFPQNIPYSLKAPDLKALLPCSEDQLRIIRERKVNRMLVHRETITSEYHFDDKGMLYREEWLRYTGRRAQRLKIGDYRFDGRGQLLFRHIRSTDASEYDSISYSDSGLLISWYSLRTFRNEKGIHDTVSTWNFRLKGFQDAQSLLSYIYIHQDSTGDSSLAGTYYFDSANNLVRIRHALGSDSLSISHLNDSEYVKTWYYKGLYCDGKGMEQHFVHGLPVREETYMLCDSQTLFQTIRRYYNFSFQPLLSEYEGAISLKQAFEYGEDGLLQQTVFPEGEQVYIHRYEYFYR